MQTLNVDVLVVGAGPTGLAAAALLTREGVGVLAITRYPGLANSPRAHVINQRTMEIFRDLDLEDTVTAAAMPAAFMGRVVWAESLAGSEIGRRDAWGAGPARAGDYAAASPCAVTNIPQHVLEPLLCARARELGADVRFNWELTRIRDEGERVRALIKDRVSGEEIEVTSRYAIGADGDNSTVVRQLGFETVGATGLGHMVNYWVEADLTRYVGHRPGALFQVFRAGGGAGVDNAMFVNVAAWNEWVVSIPFDPGLGDPARDEDGAREIVRAYVGDPDLAVRLIGTSTWTINDVHAPLMHAGRVLIAGNAAHRHPPAGGLGANTCIQDAFNLSWKLARVLRGAAGEGLLASYSEEQVPVARQIVERANTSLKALLAIPAALGLRPGQSREEGEAALASRFAPGPEGEAVRAALAAALQVQDENFNALGAELGQRYSSSAVVREGRHPEPARNPGLYYEQDTIPGSPLPHAWLTRGTQRLSTRDLAGRGRFALLVGPGGAAWRGAAEGLDVDVVAVGPGLDAEDPECSWARLRGVSEAGAVLVRPDLHVAWRADTLPDDAAGALGAALASVLSLGGERDTGGSTAGSGDDRKAVAGAQLADSTAS
ncbi:MAG: FAD-dependent monooxygenase [Arthrobacter sp.]|jgi:2,4-dichlorophenol 6-monooxygenase|nr:FAD-dependent monooxygenase [Arthrobacter sp.]